MVVPPEGFSPTGIKYIQWWQGYNKQNRTYYYTVKIYILLYLRRISWTNVQKQQDIVTKNICPKELFVKNTI